MDFLKKLHRSASNSSRKTASTPKRSLQLESLESRELLAANTLAVLTGYAQTDNPVEFRFELSTPNNGDTLLGLKGTGDGKLDPSKFVVVNRTTGATQTVFNSLDGNKTTASSGFVSLASGLYSVFVDAENGTSGNIALNIDSADAGLPYLIEASILQRQNGWNNVKNTYQSFLEPYFGAGCVNVDLMSTYGPMLNVNGDGKIDYDDVYFALNRTSGASSTVRPLNNAAQDLTAPTITVGLKNGSVTKTTDATVVGNISDASGIKAGTTQYRVNGGTWSQLAVDSYGNYVIPASVFTADGTYVVTVKADDTKGNGGSTSFTFVYAGTSITNPTVNDSGAGKASVGSGLTIQTVNGTAIATNGSLSVSGKGIVTKTGDGTLAFTVDAGYFKNLPKNKTEIVSVQALSKDAFGNLYTTTVEFKLTGVNDLPIRNEKLQESVSLSKGASGSIDHSTILSNWSDPDTGTTLSITSTTIDSVTCSNPAIKTYTPSYLTPLLSNRNDKVLFTATESLFKELGAGETLTVKVAYTVSDGDGGFVTGYLMFTVSGSNTNPTAGDFTLTPASFPYTISAETILKNGNASDLNVNDKDKLVVSSVAIRSGSGTISFSNEILVFVPDAAVLASTPVEQELVTVLAYTVKDAHGGSKTANITLKYNGTKKEYTAVAPKIASIKIDGVVVYGGSGSTFMYGGKTIDVPMVVGAGQRLGDSFKMLPTPPFGGTSFLPEGAVAEFVVEYGVNLNGTATGTKGMTTFSVTGVNTTPIVTVKTTIPEVDKTVSATTINLAGYLTITDPNIGDAHKIATIIGKSGSVDVRGASVLKPISVELASGATVIYYGNGLSVEYKTNGKFDSLAQATSATDSLALTVTDGKSGGESTSVAITIKILGKNTVPEFSGEIPNFTVTEGANSPDKRISFNAILSQWIDDETPNDLSVRNVRLDSLGTGSLISWDMIRDVAALFELDGSGLTFHANHEIFRQLGFGQNATLNFRYDVIDADGGTASGVFRVTVNGTNDLPTFEVQRDQFAILIDLAADSIILDPKFSNIKDIDLNDNVSTFGIDAASKNKGFSIDPNTGIVSIRKADAAKLPETTQISVTIKDGHSGIVEMKLSVELRFNPVVSNAELVVGETDDFVMKDLLANVQASSSSKAVYAIDPSLRLVGNSPLTNDVAIGDIATVTNGVFRFVPSSRFDYLAVDESETLTIEYDVFDTEYPDCKTTGIITVTIHGVNDAPVIDPARVTFDISNSGMPYGTVRRVATMSVFDPDRNDVHVWSLAGNPTQFSIDATTGVLSFCNAGVDLPPGSSKAFEFTVVVDDGRETATETISVTVHAKDVPVVTVVTEKDSGFHEAEIDGSPKTFSIVVSDSLDSYFTISRNGNEWYAVGSPVVTSVTVDGIASQIGLTPNLFSIVGDSVSGYELVFAPEGHAFDFLKEGEILAFEIAFTVHDNEYDIDATKTLKIEIVGEATQHTLSAAEKSFSVSINRRDAKPSDFVFDPGFTVFDSGENAIYRYSLGEVSAPSGLSPSLVTSLFVIDSETGVVALVDTMNDLLPPGDFCFTLSVLSHKGSLEAEERIVIDLHKAAIPTATDLSLTVTENQGASMGAAITTPSGGFTLDQFTVPATVKVFKDGKSRTIVLTPQQAACFAFDTTTGEFTFTPNSLFNELSSGEAAIIEMTYRISDIVYDVASTGLVRLSINGVNNAPVAKNLTLPVDIPADSTIGEKFYFSRLATDTDHGDTLTLESIKIAGKTYIFDVTDRIFVAGYGTFAIQNDGDGQGDYLLFVPTREGRFGKLLAAQNNLETETEKLAFEFTVRDSGGERATGKVNLYISGVNYRPTPANEPSTYSRTLSDSEFTYEIDLRDHFSDENGDPLSFSISCEGNPDSFVKEVVLVGNRLFVTCMPQTDFGNTTDTSAFSIVVTAKDGYSGTGSKTLSFVMDAAKTVDFTIVAVPEKSDGTAKPAMDHAVTKSSGPYYVEVWASDLLRGNSVDDFETITFGLNFAKSNCALSDFYVAGTYWEANNGVKFEYDAVENGPLFGGPDVLLLRFLVTPDAVGATSIAYSLSHANVTRFSDADFVHESQIGVSPTVVEYVAQSQFVAQQVFSTADALQPTERFVSTTTTLFAFTAPTQTAARETLKAIDGFFSSWYENSDRTDFAEKTVDDFDIDLHRECETSFDNLFGGGTDFWRDDDGCDHEIAAFLLDLNADWGAV